MFDNLHNAIGLEDSIVHYLRVPSVTVLYAVTIYSISRHILPHKDTITEEYRIAGMDSCTSHTSSTSNGGRAKAFATREGKEYYTHTQCQDESQ